MNDPHGQAGAYLEGQLDDPSAEAFLIHVTTCAACQAELHGEVQLRDREDTLRAEAADQQRPLSPPISLDAARRRRRTQVVIVAGALAVAAVVALFLWPRRPTAAPPKLSLAPTRALEPRLSWSAAAAHRPYDTARGAAGAEVIDPRVIADLAGRGDCAGVAATYVLSGELSRAAQQYDRCGGGADLDADRAALAVLAGDPERALELADRALAAAPGHPAALWNRALALRDLGFGLAAAATFERVEGEAGWTGEAGVRAAAAREPLRTAQRAHDDVERLGRLMAQGGDLLPPALARQVPARSRIYWHDALRLAATPARVDELTALLTELEGLAGKDLARYAAAARTRPSAATLDGYRRIFDRPGAVSATEWDAWVTVARRDRAGDHLLGARILTGRVGGDEPDGGAALAARTGDPWFTLAVELAQARALRAAGDLAAADARLTALVAGCQPGPQPPYRCLQIQIEAALVAIDRFALPRASVLVRRAATLATSIGEWPQRRQALLLGGDIARLLGQLTLARASYEEAARGSDGCAARHGFLAMAEVDYLGHRFAAAAAAIAQAPACDQPPEQNHVNTMARLWRAGQRAISRDQLHRVIAEARAATTVAADQDLFAYLDAWIDLGDDGARARLTALAAGAAGSDEPWDRTLASAIASTLVVDAGERGAWSEAVTLASQALKVPRPGRCALVVAVDELRLVAVALDASGRHSGHAEADRAEYRPTTWRAPAALEAAVKGCPRVEVLALPPWIGVGPVLAAEIPWSYTLGPPPPAPATTAARRVIVTATEPPRELGVPTLPPAGAMPAGAVVLAGAGATPERVLAEARTATLIELHTHALRIDGADTPVLALSPGAAGWALGPAQLAGGALTAAPVVVLASCGSGTTARYLHEPAGLPAAFRRAGARAVIAPMVPIPDREAAAFFDELGRALEQGTAPAVAVARLRAAKIAHDPASWIATVTVFE